MEATAYIYRSSEQMDLSAGGGKLCNSGNLELVLFGVFVFPVFSFICFA